MIDYSVIPKSWKPLKLGEVCIVRNGYAFKSSDFTNNGVLLFRQTNLDGENVKLKNAVYLPEEYLEKYKDYKIIKGDVLVGMSGSIGKMCVYNLDKPALQNQRTGLLRFTDLVERKFIRYYLEVLEQIFVKKSKGVAVLNISAKDIQESEFHLPSLPEQQAIVAKIEKLLSELENGKQQLLTAQQQLKVYRQSLLKWAFEGKLTNKNVKEDELPKGWKWVKSGELFSFVTSGSRGWAKFYADKGAIFIRITNMNFGTLKLDLREEKIQYVNPPSNSEGIRTKVQEGDFLFSITGYLGMFAIAPKLENAFVNQHVCLCRPKDGFDKKYVGYWIISKSGGILHLNKNQKGAVKAGLNLDDLKTFPVPICSIEEQQLIVSELEIKLTVCDKIEETISQSLQQAETLRQSILKMAFEGRLV
jgi:type I restriction enzyme, S subunit